MTETQAPASQWVLVTDQMPRDGECVYLWVEGPGRDAPDERFEVVAWPYADGAKWAKAYGGGELSAKPLMWRRRPAYQQTEATLDFLTRSQTHIGGLRRVSPDIRFSGHSRPHPDLDAG